VPLILFPYLPIYVWVPKWFIPFRFSVWNSAFAVYFKFTRDTCIYWKHANRKIH